MRALLGSLCIGILPLAASAQEPGQVPGKTVEAACAPSDSSVRGHVRAIAQGYGAPADAYSTNDPESLTRDKGAYEADIEAHLNRYEHQVDDLRLRAQDFPARDREALLRDADEMEKKSREVRSLLNGLDSGIPDERRATRAKIDAEIGELDQLYRRTGSANNWGAPFIK
jgi:hypothetical protein